MQLLPCPEMLNFPPQPTAQRFCMNRLVERPALSPWTAISVEPVGVRPALVPASVPPILVKSTWLLAKAAAGRTNARTASRSTFFPNICLLSYVGALHQVPRENCQNKTFRASDAQ